MAQQPVNEKLLDMMVRHSLDLQRHGNQLARDIVALLDSVEASIVERIAARVATIEQRGYDLGPASTKRLNKLLDDVRAINEGVYHKAEKLLADELGSLAVAEAEFHSQALAKALPIEIAATVPAPALLRSLVTTAPLNGAPLAEWVATLEQGATNRINAAIREGIVRGDSTDKIVRSIRGTRAGGYKDGVYQISRRSATQKVRTATNHVSNVARQQTWANSSVVKGWSFHAVMDLRTSSPCIANSGKLFAVGEGPIPPLHLNCRSQAVPVTKSYRELGLDKDELPPGTQATMDGQIPGDVTFESWLKKKGEAAQNELLGPTRAQWFREGKLTLSDLVSKDNRTLTLDELRKRYPGLLG